MKKQLVTINLKITNILSVVTLIIPFAIAMVLKVTIFSEYNYGLGLWDYLIVILSCPFLFALHEVVHALSFLISGVPIKSIKFGTIPKQMMLYCTTNCPISKKAYIVSLLMPLIILGVIPIAIATVFLDWKYLLLFALMVSGASGDIMMMLKLTKYKTAKMILDHPKAPAFYLLYDYGETPVDFVEVTQEMEEKLLEALKSK